MDCFSAQLGPSPSNINSANEQKRRRHPYQSPSWGVSQGDLGAFCSRSGGRKRCHANSRGRHGRNPRNKLIAQVFFDIGMIERYGGGIHRILDQCKLAGLPVPTFEHAQGGFRIAFESKNLGGVNGGVNGGLYEEANDLLALIEATPGINTKQLVSLTCKSQRSIERWLQRLREAGKIEFRGASKKGGYWVHRS